MDQNSILYKLRWNLPWLARYPLSRLGSLFGEKFTGQKHVVFTIADHFEPSWNETPGTMLSLPEQIKRLNDYHKMARDIGNAVRDADGTKFRHTNFYPAEQYYPELLDTMAEMQNDGLGEVEIHLHHGVDKPDTAENTRAALLEFRDTLAERHKCLSRWNGEGSPMYAFVHGNLALANSAQNECCGVDEEMQILQDTGCYVDMTLPSAPDKSQVPMYNQIYECGHPLHQRAPHRSGTNVHVGQKAPVLPLIFTGPLVFNWTEHIKGFPAPRLEDGNLSEKQPKDMPRFARWLSANVTVTGRPDWVFVKLYCHGFFDHDQSSSIGEEARIFFNNIIEHGEKTGEHKVYFASAREAFNMVLAAIDGKTGSPGQYRDYRLRSIMAG